MKFKPSQSQESHWKNEVSFKLYKHIINNVQGQLGILKEEN